MKIVLFKISPDLRLVEWQTVKEVTFDNMTIEIKYRKNEDVDMTDSKKNIIFKQIDATGTARRTDPYFDEADKEIIRSHELSLKISAKKPTDPDYK